MQSPHLFKTFAQMTLRIVQMDKKEINYVGSINLTRSQLSKTFTVPSLQSSFISVKTVQQNMIGNQKIISMKKILEVENTVWERLLLSISYHFLFLTLVKERNNLGSNIHEKPRLFIR